MDILPALQTGTLVVVLAKHAASDEITQVAAELALRGPVNVLDGGNRFQAYRIAHMIRRQTPDVSAAANCLFVRRAFTCYQMLALLENTPALRQPYLVLDMLSSFYDEQIRMAEAHRLLDACLRQMNRLRQFAPVAVTLGPPLVEERVCLVERVCALADSIFTADDSSSREAQFSLF